jgi:hypothetical protein
MSIADADHDGNPDVLMASCCGHNLTSLALGHGDGTFAPNYALSIGTQSHAVAFADLNNDGLPDLVINSGNGILVTSLSLYPALSTAATTTTTLSISPNPATAGQTITFSAQVASGGGTPGGTVNFMSGATVLGSMVLDSSGKATFSTSSLLAGSYNVTAVYAGSSSFSGSTSNAVTLVVAAPVVNTTTTLSTPTNPVSFGTSVSFTATVAAVSGTNIPTGMITFTDGTTALGSIAVDGTGKAILTTAALAVGNHAIEASYGGATGFAGSSSSVLTFTVNAAATPDFTVSLSPSSSTVTGGSAATSIVTVTPVAGFKQAISLSCTGAPTNSTCSFTQTSITPDGTNPATATVTVQTNVQRASLRPGAQDIMLATLLPYGLITGLALFGFGTKGRKLRLPVLLAMTAFAFLIVSGCGGKKSATTPITAPGTYPIVISANSGSISHTATFTVTVQ